MHQALCVKVEAGRRICGGFYGHCPSDFYLCSAAGLPHYAGTCVDKITARKCLKKRMKGKCAKRKVRQRKCQYTCGYCFG